jgi:4-alpha-glucanotransferase
VETPQWEGEIRLPFSQFPFTYKYAVRLPGGQLLLEVGEPRVAALRMTGSSRMGAPALLVHHDGFFRREQLWRGGAPPGSPGCLASPRCGG